jgi:sulfur-oxidizing protein SoxY
MDQVAKRMRQRGGSTRREALAVGAGLASALMVRPAAATPAEMEAAIRSFIGEAELRSGKVKLDVPLLVENGNSVPLTVAVDSPMTANDFVKAIAVFNEKNPQPNVATFQLGPRAGRATVSTRIRVADSQKLVAVAELSDGTFWAADAEVIVTLPACAEES